jgi:hypothetical protein
MARLNPKLNQAQRNTLPPSTPGPDGDDTNATAVDWRASTRKASADPTRRDALNARSAPLNDSNLDLLISPNRASLYTASAVRFKSMEKMHNSAAPNARSHTLAVLRDEAAAAAAAEAHTVLENSNSTPKRETLLPNSIHQIFATESKYDRPRGDENLLSTSPLESFVVIKSATK